MQALFTVAGLALATGILIVPELLSRQRRSRSSISNGTSSQRQDVSLGLVEPAATQVTHLLRQLPGVISVEPFRDARRADALRPAQPAACHSRACRRTACTAASSTRTIANSTLPPDGLVVSAKLAEVLGAQVGDDLLTVEVLEGNGGPCARCRSSGWREDFAGVAAYMDSAR